MTNVVIFNGVQTASDLRIVSLSINGQSFDIGTHPYIGLNGRIYPTPQKVMKLAEPALEPLLDCIRSAREAAKQACKVLSAPMYAAAREKIWEDCNTFVSEVLEKIQHVEIIPVLKNGNYTIAPFDSWTAVYNS